MSTGKDFEKEFKDSVPQDCWYYRFRDGTAAWDNNKSGKVRFQQRNICDCQIYRYPNLLLLELKSSKGSSIPFGNFRDNQVEDLTKASENKGIISGFIVKFSDHDETYFLHIDKYNMTKLSYDQLGKKSLSIDFFRRECMRILQHKLRVRFHFDIETFMNKVCKNYG